MGQSDSPAHILDPYNSLMCVTLAWLACSPLASLAELPSTRVPDPRASAFSLLVPVPYVRTVRWGFGTHRVQINVCP